MRKIIKYFEFFDTEDIKISHEIELLSNNLSKSKIIKDFDKQSPFQKILNMLMYKYAFFSEALKQNRYSYITESPSEPKIYFLNFKNEQCLIIIGLTILNDNKYDIKIVYVPTGLNIMDYGKWINVNGELLDIYRNKIVCQDFNNLDMNGIYHKIDRILIPIFKEFGFDNLLKLYKNPYDINKN